MACDKSLAASKYYGVDFVCGLFERAVSVDDIDKPIYRIFPQWVLAEAIRLNRLTLVPPSFWDDPFEVLESSISINFRSADGGFRQEIIGQKLPRLFAQSWSATADSDTLLRAYSRVVKDSRYRRNICPGEEGVKVKTTARKLKQALESSFAGQPVTTFIGDVQYASTDVIMDSVANKIRVERRDIFLDEDNRIKVLMMKRQGFCHEDEVRIGVVEREGFEHNDRILHFGVDMNYLIDEITFDPRLISFEEKERQRDFRSAGYAGSFGSSELYQKTFFMIEVRE